MAVLAGGPETRRTTTPTHRVYHAVNRPLLLCGVDRRLFFLALLIGVAVFNVVYSFLAGCFLFGVLYVGARWATGTDARMLQIVLASRTARRRYDAARHDRVEIAIRGTR